MRRRALLLDAGNTVVFLDHGVVAALVGSTEAAIRGAERAAKDGYAAALAGGVGHEEGWRVFVRTLLEEAGVPGDVGAHIAALRRAHDELNLWRRVPPELPGALEDIRAAGWTVAIVSNSEGHLAELFDAVGLAGAFEAIVDSAHVGVRKPDPRIFELALEALDVRAEDAVYAGDVPEVDVEGARAAGIEAVLIDPYDDYPAFQGAPRLSGVRALVDMLLAR